MDKLPDKLHGWYSLAAYNNKEKEYIYLNPDNQETPCTSVTSEYINPYEKGIYDSVYCGIVTTFLYSKTKFD
jgi:peptide methionine sulfoxide reductase MsrB